jgi:hypothetical protein
MSPFARRVLRHAGAWMLLALLAVPLAMSGHRHEPLHPQADSCALCAAVGSVAAAAVQASPQLTIVLQASAHRPPVRLAPADRPVVARPARGPPPASPPSLA